MPNAIPASVFAENTDVRLRVWFSTDNASFELLSPDRRIASGAYALSAQQAETVADAAITEAMLADGAVSSAKIRPSFYQGTPSNPGVFDLSAGIATANVSFYRAFDTIPDVSLPVGWTLSGATETVIRPDITMLVVSMART